MSEEEHSDKENSEDTALSGYKQVYENSQEEIENFVNKQKSENTTRKTFSDMKTFQRYLSLVNKGNEEVLDLPAGDLDHLLAKSLHIIFKMYIIMSETFIEIDSLQHLEISRQTYPMNQWKICITAFTVLTFC